MDEMLGEGWGTARNSLFGSQAAQTPRLANNNTNRYTNPVNKCMNTLHVLMV